MRETHIEQTIKGYLSWDDVFMVIEFEGDKEIFLALIVITQDSDFFPFEIPTEKQGVKYLKISGETNIFGLYKRMVGVEQWGVKWPSKIKKVWIK